jgi:TIR domain-containing protein
MTSHATSRVFLSYRREETKHAAGRLADRIAERFSSSQVFVDVDSIPPGVDFSEATQHAISGCDVLLALIGPRWTTLENAEGRRRLDDPEDFVVLELRAALDRGIPVIPVLVDGANMPTPTELPPGLERFTRRNAVHLDAETFRQDVSWLLSELAKILSAAPRGRTVGAGTRVRATAARARQAARPRARARRRDDGRAAARARRRRLHLRRSTPKARAERPVRRRRGRRLMAPAAGALLLAAIAAAALAAGHGDRQDVGLIPAAQPVSFPELGVAHDAVWALGEDSMRIWRSAPGERPTPREAPAGTTQLAAGPAGAWSGGDDGVLRADRAGASTPLAGPPDDIAVAADGVWALDAAAGQIVWIANGHAYRGSAPPGAVAVAADGEGAWLLDGDGRVHAMRADDEPSVDPRGVESGLSDPDVMAAEGRTVWVLDRDEGTLARVDPDSARGVIVARDFGDVTGMAAGDGVLWLARSDGTAAPYSSRVTSRSIRGPS